MEQQTAIDWYDQELRKCMMGTVPCDPIQIREQANQMFQEQIQKAFSDGQQTPINNPTTPHYSREEYFKEKYKR
jgi:hypothetical protein